jgi:hypothetical protein
VNAALGRTATRIHLVLMIVVATAGMVLLVTTVSAMLLTDDQYSRDMGLLGLVLTAPLWIVGLAAGVDAVLVLRRRPVARLRALLWALLVVVGSAFVGLMGGLFGALLTLAAQPGRVHLEWPELAVPFGDGGVHYYYLDSPMLWLPVVGVLLGAVSLVAQVRDRWPRGAA